MLLFILVMCGMCASLFYLARVPQVVEDWYALWGQPVPPQEDTSRRTWLIFVIFTYVAPLLLASFLHLFSAIAKWMVPEVDMPEEKHPLS